MSRIVKEKIYLEHTYSTEIAPIGSYPSKLAEYLYKNYYLGCKSIADFGCGRGDYLIEFKKHFSEIVGYDISPIVQDINQMDFEEEHSLAIPAYDCAFSKSVIEHLHNPINFLRTINNHLIDDGKVVIMTPSWEHTHWGPFYIDHTHVTPFTKASLKSAMEMSGFKNVKVEYFYQLPILWKHWWLLPFIKMISILPIPYQPYHNPPWKISHWFNKLIRFSNEPMLLATGTK